MNIYDLEAQAVSGPLVFGEATETLCMGIDTPDGRALLLDCCGVHDVAFLRLVVHRYNNFMPALAALKEALGAPGPDQGYARTLRLLAVVEALEDVKE